VRPLGGDGASLAEILKQWFRRCDLVVSGDAALCDCTTAFLRDDCMHWRLTTRAPHAGVTPKFGMLVCGQAAAAFHAAAPIDTVPTGERNAEKGFQSQKSESP
jgi:hypothetical protein